MSYETDEQFTNEQDAEQAEAEAQARADKARMIKLQLEKGKPFKDLLKDKSKEWELVKSSVKEDIYNLIMVGNDVVTRDFLAGIKHCLDVIETRVKEFDHAFEQLGRE